MLNSCDCDHISWIRHNSRISNIQYDLLHHGYDEVIHTDSFPCKPFKTNKSLPLKEWKLKSDGEFIILLVDRIEAIESIIS